VYSFRLPEPAAILYGTEYALSLRLPAAEAGESGKMPLPRVPGLIPVFVALAWNGSGSLSLVHGRNNVLPWLVRAR